MFHADGATETGVVTQSSIYSENKQAANEEFAAAVMAAYRAARPKWDRQANDAYWADHQAKLGREIEEEDEGDFGDE